MLLKNFGIEDLDGGWIFNGSFSYTLSTIIIGQIRVCKFVDYCMYIQYICITTINITDG